MNSSNLQHKKSMLGLASFVTFAIAVGYSPLTSADAEPNQIQSNFSERPVLLATSLVTQSAVAEINKTLVATKAAVVIAQATPEHGLADHLNQIEARMYGAYWCPYCARQIELFGEAFDTIDYVECDARGQNAQPQLCINAGVQAYPTWEINGELYPGLHSLEDLANLSGYTGSTDFSK